MSRPPQERFHEIDVGAPVTVRLDALPGRPIDGEVAAKVPVNDPTARTFLLRVRIDNPGGLVNPGMSAQAQFRIQTGRRGVIVPRDGLVRQADGSSNVWIVNGSGDKATVSQRQVELGRTLADGIEIRTGLEGRQRVVVRGNEILTEGQPVRILGLD